MTTVAIVNDGREIGTVTWTGSEVEMSPGARALIESGVRVVDESLVELQPDSEEYVERLPLCLAGTRVWAEPRAEGTRAAILDEVKARAYVESQHPRDPGGEGGGQWIKKGTTAEGSGVTITGSRVDPYGSKIPSVSIEPTILENRYGEKAWINEFVSSGGISNPTDYVYGHGLKVKKNGEVGQQSTSHFVPAGGIPPEVLAELERVSREYLAAHGEG